MRSVNGSSRLSVLAWLAIGGSAGSIVFINGCGDSAPTDCVSRNTCADTDAAGGDGGGADGQMDGAGGETGVDSGADSNTDAPNEGSTGCDGGLVCNGSCVDPNSPMHCGSCSNVCPAPTNGTATCANPTCGIQCNNTFHACQGACLPNSNEPGMDACVIDDAFGVFVDVAHGNDSNACTKASPCKTIGKGLTTAHSSSKRVYVCEGTYDEQLVVDANVDNAKVFGGFACVTWAYDVNKKPLVAPSARGYAMVLSGTTSVLFEDFAFQAQAGSAAGESSIAIFAKSANGLVFRRVNIRAGNGKDATNAGTSSNYTNATAPDGSGPAGNRGGAGGSVACTNGDSSTAGNGGDGVVGRVNGGTGSSVPPATTSTGFDGLGGGGGTTSCSGADPGANGASGSSGTGVASSGTLDVNGWHAAGGGAGTSGSPGQGAGGGGGKSTLGVGGGGGGSGGCGGGAGAGGSGGGASVAILSFHSNITLDTCTLTMGNGGKGGDGGTGQVGQAGGAFATIGAFCQGNYGGNGGGGGGGSGGAGGLSVGVLYSMTAPTLTSTTVTLGSAGTGGAAGAGGAGGTNSLGTGSSGATGSAGPAGTAVQTLSTP